MNRARVALIVLLACIPIGMAGATAFNPDSGALLHSEVLWRIFGIMAEGGVILLLAIGVCVVVVVTLRAALHALRSRHV